MKRIASIMFAALFAAGCSMFRDSPKGQPVDIVIDWDDKDAQRGAAIDIIGATERERTIWEDYSVDRYWDGDDAQRKNADKIERVFSVGGPKTHRLTLADAEVKRKWDSWRARGVTYIVVMTRVTNPAPPTTPRTDPRKAIVPLTKTKLEEQFPGFKVKALRIVVQPAGIRVDPLESIPK